MKRVSVIIPTFNRAHLICDAIKSVLNQDIQDCELEIIVVDDGSIDKTREVVSKLNGPIKYIYQDNQGVGSARNRGISEASGEWLAFLDSDDIWLPDKLSLQFKILNLFPQYSIIHSNFYSSDGNKIIFDNGLGYWVTLLTGEDINQINWKSIYSEKFKSHDFGITRNELSFNIYAGNIFSPLLYTVCANCWTSIIHKDCIGNNIRFSNLPIVEDYWFYCKLSEKNNVIFIDCPTVENRSHSGPRESQGKKIDLLKGCRTIYKEIYIPSVSAHRPYNKNISDRIRSVNSHLFMEYLKNGYLLKAINLIKKDTNNCGVDIKEFFLLLSRLFKNRLPKKNYFKLLSRSYIRIVLLTTYAI